MLSKNDLDQIRSILKEEFDTEFSPLKNNIEMMDAKIEIQINNLDQKLTKAQEDISEILKALDRRQTHVETRLEAIEETIN